MNCLISRQKTSSLRSVKATLWKRHYWKLSAWTLVRSQILSPLSVSTLMINRWRTFSPRTLLSQTSSSSSRITRKTLERLLRCDRVKRCITKMCSSLSSTQLSLQSPSEKTHARQLNSLMKSFCPWMSRLTVQTSHRRSLSSRTRFLLKTGIFSIAASSCIRSSMWITARRRSSWTSEELR